MYKYAGIGARKTPKDFLDLMERVAFFLSKNNILLRSGGADGADNYFEKGCDRGFGNKEIFLPWKGFNKSNSNLIVSEKAFQIAESYHSNWQNLKWSVKSLFSRNVHQILGYELNDPVNFVLCWTENGLGKGGTGFALSIAKKQGIPIFDMGKYSNVSDCREDLIIFLKKQNISNL